MTHDVQTPIVSADTHSRMFDALVRAEVKVLAGVHSALRSLQVARMMSVLSDMSDHQLDQIGITRSEIPDYAEKLQERGIDVSYETIRRWTARFGPQIARNLRRRQVRPGDIWHLDEVVVKIAGRMFWLWLAVDQYGVVLDETLQPRRDKRAAQRLLIKLMKRFGFAP